MEIQPVHSKGDQSWVFFGRNDAKAETPVLWPPHARNWLIGKDWCWEGLRAGGEEDNRGWDGWMASPTQWTWVWVNSWSWWWTGRPGVLRFMGPQRAWHDWATELNWTEKIDSYLERQWSQVCLSFLTNLLLKGRLLFHPGIVFIEYPSSDSLGEVKILEIDKHRFKSWF